ncbi:hypothetical protein V6N13_145538 [Hibiscus sabdariffa]|uniref:Uncharacterized protein n=2 Tax=Hibiscus sabdariffa TaxID=183260 RepID=A0ABR1ZKP5_9ROSI
MQAAMRFFCNRFTYIIFAYQGYADGNSPIVAFIAFLTICDLGVLICKQQLDGLPPMETSLRKHFLKSAVWFYQSAIFFGFVYLFYTFVHPVAAVFMFVIAVCASYFVYVLLNIVPHGHLQAPETPSTEPCKFMKPMAANFTDVEFVKLDIDELPVWYANIVLLKNMKEVDRVVGAQK